MDAKMQTLAHHSAVAIKYLQESDTYVDPTSFWPCVDCRNACTRRLYTCRPTNQFPRITACETITGMRCPCGTYFDTNESRQTSTSHLLAVYNKIR